MSQSKVGPAHHGEVPSGGPKYGEGAGFPLRKHSRANVVHHAQKRDKVRN
ncbi:MAG: hypothetical protein Q4A71_00035 [Actinomycetaceae bacterium]|nr:hypothetical protein [Actinomycetaceae bacterium]